MPEVPPPSLNGRSYRPLFEQLEDRLTPSLTATGSSLHSSEGVALVNQTVATFHDSNPILPPVILPDAGFENVRVGTGSFYSFAYGPGGSPWSFADGAGVAGDNSGFTSGNPAAPDGSQVAFLQGLGHFGQAVLFSSGTYQLHFQSAQRGNWNQGGQTFQVTVDGSVVGTFTPGSATYAGFDTNAFTVTAGTHVVAFAGLNPHGGDNTAFVDGVNAVRLGANVLNAGFEAPAVGANSFSAFQYAPGGTAWTFAGGAGVAGNNSGFTAGNLAAPEGGQVGFVQSVGSSFSQTAAFAAGTYSIRFQAAQRGNWQPGGAQSVQVLLDGTVIGTVTPTGTSYAGYQSNAFTVAAGNHTLAFVALTPDDSTAFIDGISVQTVDTNTPATAEVDWGDNQTSAGTIDYDAATDAFLVLGSHAYTTTNTYAVSVGIIHGTDTADASSTATITDAPLTVSGLSLTADANGHAAGVVGLFTDADPNAGLASNYTASIAWRDGGSSTGTVSRATPIAGNGFESPDVGSDNFYAFQYAPGGTPWTFSGGAGVSGNNSGFTSGNAAAPDGKQVGVLQGTGSISQSITLPAGTFTLSLQAAQRGNWNQGGQTFQVTVDGNVVGTFTPTSPNYATFRTNTFTIAAGAHVLAFTGLNPLGGDNTAFIDGVHLDQPIFQVTAAHDYSKGGTYSPTVTVHDAGGANGSDNAAVNVPAQPLTLATVADQSSNEGDAVSVALVAGGGGAGLYTYLATGLPDGLTVDAQTGVISGTIAAGAAATNNGSYTVSASVTDGVNTASQSFAWTVQASTPALALDNPGDQFNFEAEDVSTQLTVSGGSGGPVTYAAVGLPAGLHINAATGLISGTIDYSAAETNDGTYSVLVSAHQGNVTDTQTFTWLISDTPRAPVTHNDSYATDENTPLTIDNPGVLANDSDPDGNPISAFIGDGPTHGTLDLSPTGGFTFTPEDNWNGSVIVGYFADDGLGNFTPATITFTVRPGPDSPVVTRPNDRTNAENDAVTLQVVATQPLGDALIYAANGLPDGLSIDPDTGLISGTISFDAAEVNDGSYRVEVSATDSQGHTSAATFAWQVSNVNQPPVLTNPGDQSGFVGVVVSLPLDASDADGDPLTFTATGLPTGLTLDPNSGIIAGKLSQAGTFTTTVTADDGLGGTATQTFAWTVAPNAVPVAVAHSHTLDENQALTIDAANGLLVGASDADGDPLTAVDDPAHGTLTVNADGSFVYVPTRFFFGTDRFVFTAVDIHGAASVPVPVTLTINHVPQPAQVTTLLGSAYQEGDTVTLTSNLVDPDLTQGTQTITVDWADGSPIETFTRDAGTTDFTATHKYGEEGTYAVVVTLSDDAGRFASDTQTLIIADALPQIAIETMGGAADCCNSMSAGLSAKVTVTDPGVNDQLGGTVNWGDGTSSDISGKAKVSLEHTYEQPGTFQIFVEANDDEGTRSTAVGSPITLFGALPDDAAHVIAVDDTFTLTDGVESTDADSNAVVVYTGPGNVLANDKLIFDNPSSGPYCDMLKAQLLEDVSSSIGHVVLNDDGNFTLTVRADYSGPIEWRYRAKSCANPAIFALAAANLVLAAGKAKVTQLQFTSDHKELIRPGDKAGLESVPAIPSTYSGPAWKLDDDGKAVVEPVTFTAGEDQKIKLTLTFAYSGMEQLDKFIIKGESDEAALNFESTERRFNNKEGSLPVDMVATNALGPDIRAIEGTIRWKLIVNPGTDKAETISLGETGTCRIYTTFGKPITDIASEDVGLFRPSDFWATEARMKFAVQQASAAVVAAKAKLQKEGKEGFPSIPRIVHEIMKATAKTFNINRTQSNPWKVPATWTLEGANRGVDCLSTCRFVNALLKTLGVPGVSVKTYIAEYTINEKGDAVGSATIAKVGSYSSTDFFAKGKEILRPNKPDEALTLFDRDNKPNPNNYEGVILLSYQAKTYYFCGGTDQVFDKANDVLSIFSSLAWARTDKTKGTIATTIIHNYTNVKSVTLP